MILRQVEKAQAARSLAKEVLLFNLQDMMMAIEWSKAIQDELSRHFLRS